MKLMDAKVILLVLALGVLFRYGFNRSTATEATPPAHTEQKAEEAPVRAQGVEIPAYLTDRPEEIIRHDGFTLSYNNRHLLPNWVAWVLTSARLQGSERRADNFQPDMLVQNGPVADTYDYRGSGYDRGHMCPAADCKHSRQSQNDCFLMTNICPQTHQLNAGDWQTLEDLCRRWARRYDSIYIVCGPVLKKGARYDKIGQHGVSVPRQFWKAVLRMNGEEAHAIAFVFDNDESEQPLSRHAVTVDSVEALTGINLFSKLPKHVERKAEATFDLGQWRGIR